MLLVILISLFFRSLNIVLSGFSSFSVFNTFSLESKFVITILSLFRIAFGLKFNFLTLGSFLIIFFSCFFTTSFFSTFISSFFSFLLKYLLLKFNCFLGGNNSLELLLSAGLNLFFEFISTKGLNLLSTLFSSKRNFDIDNLRGEIPFNKK